LALAKQGDDTHGLDNDLAADAEAVIVEEILVEERVEESINPAAAVELEWNVQEVVQGEQITEEDVNDFTKNDDGQASSIVEGDETSDFMHEESRPASDLIFGYEAMSH
jgi:hypothetical protein